MQELTWRRPPGVSYDREKLLERLAKLVGGVAIIKVNEAAAASSMGGGMY